MANARRVACIGDSITEGFGVTTQPWPQLIQSRRVDQNVAVKNLANSGEKVALFVSRYYAEVQGRKYTDVVFGPITNDLPDGTTGAAIYAAILPAFLAAKADGSRVYTCTTLPRKNAAAYSMALETERVDLNTRLRAANADVPGIIMIDFDLAIRDPADISAMQSGFHTGDWLHPNNAGYIAMADRFDIDVSW